MSTLALDESMVPGALKEYKSRRLADGSMIEFESAPAGWLMPNGERRRRDWRAYHYLPAREDCACGNGRLFDRSTRGRQCPACNGTGVLAPRIRLQSVSTVLDAICPKPGLPHWAEGRGIEGTLEAIRIGLIDLDDPASVANAVAAVRAAKLGKDREDRTTLGLNVHACLEHYMRTGSPPSLSDHAPEHWGCLTAMSKFLLKRQPERDGAMIEELVAHPEHGYAGRLDLRARSHGKLIGWDAKTAERGCVYLGAHVQLNLYELAAVHCGDEPADELYVVVFADDGEFYEIPANHGDDFVRAGLAWLRASQPVESLCSSHNRGRVEKRAT